MSCKPPVIAVSCLSIEARIARGPGVLVLCDHADRLVTTLDAAASRGAAGIISFGIAGGLAPDLAAGDWVVGTGVRTNDSWFPADQAWARRLLAALPAAIHADIAGVDAPVADTAAKQDLHRCSGAAAVDMESHLAARIAAAYRIPFAACRVVVDPADVTLPPAALVGLRQDGTADLPAILRSLRAQPRQLPALVRTTRDAGIACSALRRGRQAMGTALGCPYVETSAAAGTRLFADRRVLASSAGS
jgi:adenosylhomocysteine nucleosidase